MAYRRNDVIFTGGSPGRELFIIKKGRMKISLSNAEWKDLIINILSAGDILGDMVLFSGLSRSAAAIVRFFYFLLNCSLRVFSGSFLEKERDVTFLK